MRRDPFQAIADPVRRKILVLTSDKPVTPNSMAEEFRITRQAVSKHIKILFECELLVQERAGREIYYHLNPVKMQEIDLWLEQFKKHWINRFDQLDKVLLNLNSDKNEN
jgi:DNA-binding transcriptional ArsR family regulator